MRLQACANGARLPEEHPGPPITPTQLARESAAAGAEGARAVQLHVKNDEGRDTVASESLAAMLEAVRIASPELPIGVTTGAWALPGPADRVRAIGGWTTTPDFASVEWHEPGADDVAAALLDRGVAVEAGPWHGEAVEARGASPHRDRCLRVLLELPDHLKYQQTVAMGERLLAPVRSTTGGRLPVLLHGEGSSAWPALRRATELGLATRIGLEDTLEGPDRLPVQDNAELVWQAVALLRRVHASR